MRSRITRIVVAFALANTLAVAIVWACGPFITPIATVGGLDPAQAEAFDAGEIGIVRPDMRRANLAKAYQIMTGATPATVERRAYAPTAGVSYDLWHEARAEILGPASVTGTGRTRRIFDYVTPINCLEDAYETAVRTLRQRETRYGAGSAAVRDWARAQDAVFANCDETPLSLPEPAPPGADALTKADRDYQSAAAYFYGFQLEEARRRFRAIGNDVASPWRPYGRYLAARASIRLHTFSGYVDQGSATLADAENELRAVITDPIAAPVHDSARGLLEFVQLRLRPNDQLREVASRIAAGGTIACCAFEDFTYLMDRQVGDTVDYRYELAVSPELRDTHDLVDWVLAMQGQGDEARDRAISRWQQTKSVPWLVAALSRTRDAHAAVESLLDAAAVVPASSPGFASVSFYRVRLLIDLGRRDEARAVLATLPDAPGPGAAIETINLYRAQRSMVADTFDEWLTASVRTSLFTVRSGGEPTRVPVFDEDAGAIFNEQLPLDRLIAAAESTTLPGRLRARVATAAFTRSVLLNRHDRALIVAPILRSLAPELAGDLDRYMRETTVDGQRRAAVLLFLRTPGMTSDIRGLDDNYSIDVPEPRRVFENFVPVWWCDGRQRRELQEHRASESATIRILYPSRQVPPPAFITQQDRAMVEREFVNLDATGPATRYLATATLEWAAQRPRDPEAAEALSRIVNGWRRACRDPNDFQLAQRAFQALHRQFPSTEWAKRTPYWYR
jgi:hypothetical protein